MSKKSATANVVNRSPWLVTVSAYPQLSRRFPYGKRKDAEQHLRQCHVEGRRAKLEQLETSFQLRVRRKGVKDQVITFDTPQEAEQARKAIEAELSVSIVRDYAVAARTTLAELMERYIAEVAHQHKGGDIEISRMRRLIRAESFPHKKLAALTTQDLQDFVTERQKQVSKGTVDRDIDMVAQTLNYADSVWKIAPADSPLKGLQRPKYCNERDRRLSKSEEERLLAAARADENPYVEPLIIVALETAMRRGELLSLMAANIDYERREAVLPNSITKNGRSRRVPLSSRAIQVLSALPVQPDGSLFPISHNALKKAFFGRVLPRARIEGLRFHDLRHEAISRLAESGKFQLVELQAISGHRDMRMLLRYSHLLSGTLASKMDEATTASGTPYTYEHRGRRRLKGKAQMKTVDSTSIAPAHDSKVTDGMSDVASETSATIIPFGRAKVAA